MTHDHIPIPRQAALAMSPQQFRAIGHGLVDRLADSSLICRPAR